MAGNSPGQQAGRDTWTRTEPPPKNAGEPESVRDTWDAQLKATGGRHR